MLEPSTLPHSLLRFEHSWVESLSFSIRPDWESRTGAIGVGAVLEIREAAEPDLHHYVDLRISSEDGDADGSQYDFALAIVGRFSVDPDATAEESDRLIALNAPAALYGIARGVLATMTGVGPLGPLLLPSVNLVAALATMDD